MKNKIYLSLLCCIFSYVIACTSTTYAASAAPHCSRLQGKDKYETAVKVSQSNWEKSRRVVLVSGDNFADALCAAPLAKKYNAPILFTEQNKLTTESAAELLRLKPELVLVIGGNGVIGEEVTKSLVNFGMEFTRIGGKDRYETSLLIANTLQLKDKVAIVSGENYPDALSIASIAANLEIPILLTKESYLPEPVASYLQNKQISTSYVVGGTSVINDTVYASLPNGKRLAGINRYETNLAVLNEFETLLNYTKLYAVSGETFTDALATSAVAAKACSPLLLINPKNPSETEKFTDKKVSKALEIQIVGNQDSIPTSFIRKLLGQKSCTIVLDPGHGGKDPGAIAQNWLQEKDVNLQVALKVGKLLEDNGIDVVYTRDSDTLPWQYSELVDLQNRSKIANSLDTTYFVSIHSNSCGSPSMNGTATYYQGGREDSYKLAQHIQEQLISSAGTRDNGLLTANFYVLRNTNSPAVLIELAYLSNTYEASLLSSESFQKKCADGISKGILKALQ